MEFRDKLLSSEIRHVTEMVNMLSYELVILQDFLKEEFGVRYSRYRRRHALASETTLLRNTSENNADTRPRPPDKSSRRHGSVSSTVTTEQKVAINIISAKSTNKSSSIVPARQSNPEGYNLRTQEASSSNSNPAVEGDNPLGNERPLLFDDNNEISLSTHKGSEEHITPDFVDDDDFVMEEDNDNESISSSDSSNDSPTKKGHRLLEIWSKFNTRILPNGKKKVSCRKCFSAVSAVPKRMEKHYRKCCLNLSVSDSEPVNTVPRSRKTPLPRGTVWVHFNQETDSNGKPTVLCKYCGLKVSNHSTRMARHLQKCDRSPVYGTSEDSTQTFLESNQSVDT